MGRVMVGAALAAALFLGGCATQPLPLDTTQAMPDMHRQAAIPAGFISFCLRFTDQCRPSATDVILLNSQSWKTLTQVNRDVNNAIWPEDDIVHYGRAEYWTIPTDARGDCDDYAVTKRKDLIDAGFPSGALRLAVVYSQASGRHAVLTVATDKGDFVLDNLANDVKAWNDTGYMWIERQDGSDPFKWVSLQTPLQAAQADGENLATAAITPDSVPAPPPVTASTPAAGSQAVP